MDEVTNVWEWPASQCGSGIRTDPDYRITSVGRCFALVGSMRSTECRFLRVSAPAAAHPSSSSSSDPKPSVERLRRRLESFLYADFCVYRKHHAFVIRLTDPSRRHCWKSRNDWLIDWPSRLLAGRANLSVANCSISNAGWQIRVGTNLV